MSDEELDAFVQEATAGIDLDGKTVVLVVPDHTRSCPLPLVLHALHRHLAGRVASLTAVIALGTHSYMESDEIDRYFGVGGPGQPTDLAEAYPGLTVVNHEWADPAMLVTVGHDLRRTHHRAVGRPPVGGSRHRHQPARRGSTTYAIVVGPVFPHEVVGLLRGQQVLHSRSCLGQEFIDVTHWVGALITS